MSRLFLFSAPFNSKVRPAETQEGGCRGDFPDESLGGFALDFKWDVLIGERFQSRFGNQMLPRTKDPAGKASEQKGQRPLFRLAVRECNRHHGSYPFGHYITLRASHPAKSDVWLMNSACHLPLPLTSPATCPVRPSDSSTPRGVLHRRLKQVARRKRVAVGTDIADRPPHRSVRAALPHTVLIADT